VPLLAPRWPVDGRTPAGGPPVAATVLTGHLGLLRACSGSGAMRPAPAATSGCGKCHYWRPDGPWTAEHPLVVPGWPRRCSRAIWGFSGPVERVLAQKPRTGGGDRRQRFMDSWSIGATGSAQRDGRGREVLLSWGFSVTDPDSGTADLASTTAWVNDHFRKLLILKDFRGIDR